ncbi:MAG TPA: conjugal transfer protein, partial [Streptosporangiaceae bacterium]
MYLPTYTSIWRIEKRLYKLYDFRLPMPLPIGQVAVFAAIAVPYVVLLTVLGLPFNHTLIWLYVLPPGLATWLVTRPVLESKRLPELIKSQLRYLAEPRVLCRMAPLAERDVVLVTARVWRPQAPRTGRRGAEALAETATRAPDPDGGIAAQPAGTRASLRREPLPP